MVWILEEHLHLASHKMSARGWDLSLSSIHVNFVSEHWDLQILSSLKVPGIQWEITMSCCKEKKTDCCSSPVNFKPDQIPNRLSEENAADFANLTIPMLREILRKLPLADLLLAASVCRHWHTVSNFVISTSSLCLCYRLKCYCESSNGKSPANVALDGHCCEADKSLKVNQIADFAESNLAKRVERLALCCPANIHDSDHVGVLPSDLFYLAKKFPNVNKLEFTGNDVDIFYIPLGRPVLSNLFPQISEILWFCDAPEYQIRLKCHQADNFMPAIKLDCKEKYPATLIAALAKVDSFIEALRAEGLVNPQTFR